MRRLFIALSFLFSTVATLASEPAPVPDTPIVKITFSGQGNCSGTYLGHGLVLTAGHCVYNENAPMDQDFKVHSGEFETRARVVHASNPYMGFEDIALLSLQNTPDDWKPQDLDCKYVPTVGDDVTSWGYPRANDGLTFAKGYINAETREGADMWGAPLIYVTLPTAGGASGGPLLKGGKQIGIIVATNNFQPAWSYAQPIDSICNFMAKRYGP